MAQRFSGLLTNNALKMCMSNVPRYRSNTAGSNVGTGTWEKSAIPDWKAKEEKQPAGERFTLDMKPSQSLRDPDSRDLKKEQEEYAKHEEEHKREGRRAQELDE